MDAKKLVREYYLMWNEQSFKKSSLILDEKLRFTSSLGVETNGLTAFLEYTQMVLTAFPNLHHATEIMVAEQNNVAVYVSYTGTHKGQLFEFEPSFERIKYSGASFFTIQNDKIKEVRVLGDRYTLYKQIAPKSI